MNTISLIPYSAEKHRAVVIEWLIDLQEIERKLKPVYRPGADMVEAYFEDIYASVQSGSGAIVVAESEGKPVGFIAYFIVHDDDVTMTEEANVYGYVSDVYVEKSWRGKGLFKLLEANAVEHFKKLGMKSMKIEVVAENEAAIAAYTRSGYAPEEIRLRKNL